MAVYKVLQDIEAEDKFIGPLTIKQFVFAGITAICLYLSVWSVSKNLIPLLALLLPVAFVCGFLAWPWGRDQSTEVWLAAKLRFMIKPRKRIWNQSGIKNLVTITVPKHIEEHLTNGLSQTEVKSRLGALADTLDSRGWAIKNINVNLYGNPVYSTEEEASDRLVGIDSLPQQVEEVDVLAADDMMDPRSNPLAQQLDQMINQSSQNHRADAIDRMQHPAQAPATLPAPIPGGVPYTTFGASPVVAPISQDTGVAAKENQMSDEEQKILKKLQKDKEIGQLSGYGHTKVIQPLDDKTLQAQRTMPQPVQADDPTVVTPPVDPAILELAKNDDLNVATIARQAKRQSGNMPDGEEVVISLH